MVCISIGVIVMCLCRCSMCMLYCIGMCICIGLCIVILVVIVCIRAGACLGDIYVFSPPFERVENSPIILVVLVENSGD